MYILKRMNEFSKTDVKFVAASFVGRTRQYNVFPSGC